MNDIYDKEVAGVGWSLHSTEGNQHLRGSSSIRQTNTPPEAETEALITHGSTTNASTRLHKFPFLKGIVSLLWMRMNWLSIPLQQLSSMSVTQRVSL